MYKHFFIPYMARIQKKFILAPLITLLVPISASFALQMNYESYIATNLDKIEYNGDLSSEQFGAAIASGDLNGDGFQDLVIGSPFASREEMEWNGAVSVVFGGNSAKSSYDMRFFGERSGDQLGTSLTVGDYNNDGIDDMAIGAYNAYYQTKRPGKVYIIFGESTWGSQLTTQPLNIASVKPDYTLIGEAAGDQFGLSLTTLDINNDGIEDLLVGAPKASSEDVLNSGLVYAYHGGGPEIVQSVVFNGHQTGEKFGSVIGGGHILGNALNDLIIGAYTSSTDSLSQSGKVYFYKGLKESVTVAKNPTIVIEGTSNSGWFGFDLDVNDLDGDGIDDIAISSFPYLSADLKGEIFIIYGNNNFIDQGPKFFDSSEFVLNLDFEQEGTILCGASVMVADLDNNYPAEVITGCPGVGHPVSIEAGNVYIFYGNDTGDGPVSLLHGENPDDWFGYSMALIDSEDELPGLVIGSRYSDTNEASNNGKVFVVTGREDPYGYQKIVVEDGEYITRGDFISIVIDSFDLKNKKKSLIDSCYEHKEFCFFNFSAKSLYDELTLEPEIILYPDVLPDDEYYESIVIATMLDLMNGYINEENSPFRPEGKVSRIQALKVILGAAELVESKYRFELINSLGSYDGLIVQDSYFVDVNPAIEHMWWYPRYVNFAVDNGIVDLGEFFRPDDEITVEEFYDMLTRTLEFLTLQE